MLGLDLDSIIIYFCVNSKSIPSSVRPDSDQTPRTLVGIIGVLSESDWNPNSPIGQVGLRSESDRNPRSLIGQVGGR